MSLEPNIHKSKEGEPNIQKKWLNHFESLSFHTLEEPFHLENLWFGGEGEELKALKRSLRGVKEDKNWFWFPYEIMLLLCWVANHL